MPPPIVKLTTKQRQAILRRCAAGQTTDAIAAEFGIGPKRVAAMRLRAGIEARPYTGSRLTQAQRDDAVYWVHRLGYSPWQVARFFGVNHGTIFRHAQRHGPALPDDYEPQGPPPPGVPDTRRLNRVRKPSVCTAPPPESEAPLNGQQAGVLAAAVERHGWRAERVQVGYGGRSYVEVRDLAIRWTPVVAKLHTAAAVQEWLDTHPHGLRGRVPTTADLKELPVSVAPIQWNAQTTAVRRGKVYR